MNYAPGKLTDNQIKAAFFQLPLTAIEFAMGVDYAAGFEERRSSIRAQGGELLFIGWPDGTIVEYKRPDPTKPLDANDIAAFYRLFHKAKAMVEQGGSNE